MSSSAEQTHTSAVRSSTSLEQLHKKATEAVDFPLLWEIGMLAPSPNQATKVCAILGLENEDEKRVKAVAVLNRDNPQLLEEISGETTLQGEKTMRIERGESFYAREERKKAMEFLPKLMDICNIVTWSDKGAYPAEEFRFSLSLPDLTVIQRPYPKGAVIEIAKSNGWIYPFAILIITPSSGKFFEARRGLDTSGWHDIHISVKDRKFMSLAQKVGEAFESAMRRRRSDAQAIILRDYYK